MKKLAYSLLSVLLVMGLSPALALADDPAATTGEAGSANQAATGEAGSANQAAAWQELVEGARDAAQQAYDALPDIAQNAEAAQQALDEALADATAIELGQQVYGSISDADVKLADYDNAPFHDFYSFDTSVAGTYALTVSNLTRTDGPSLVTVQVLDDSGTAVATTAATTITTYKAQLDGNSTYYLDVNSPTALDYIVSIDLTDSSWTRLGGATRYATMSAIAEEACQDDACNFVILASGLSYADALTASSLSGVLDAPIITTDPQLLSNEARMQIARIASGSTKVLVIGGASAVAQDVAAEAGSIPGCAGFVRLGGADRIATATAIYNHGKGQWGDTCIVTNAWNYPDALSVGSYAAVNKAPIFGATNGKLTSAQASAIKAGGFKNVLVLGGNDAVDFDAVKAQLGTGLKYVQLGGATRLQTSAAIVNWACGYSTSKAFSPATKLTLNGVCVATALDFPDALTAVTLAGPQKAAILLVDRSQTSSEIIQSVIGNRAASIYYGYVIGGTRVVSSKVFNECQDAAQQL